ncbi:MAG: AAA family ATPase [Candidatus Micrarchaeota archaeon]|nr:AAA family ATPase [Candidatus Micrarchaeota archaeon]
MDGLILNESVLLPEFQPERLPGREGEIEEIAHNFRLALEGRKPQNLLIHGPPGTGKTAVLKHVMGLLEEYSSKVRIAYVNCWNAGTRYGVLGEVARKVGFISPMKGTAVEDLLRRIAEISVKRGLYVVVVLDEMDRLVASGHGDVLYDLSRMNEVYGARVSVVGVVNDFGLVMSLDPRIRSSVISKDIEFKGYTVPLLKRILIERARHAFKSADDEAVGLCAAHAYKCGGDARLAISLLLAAGRIAEKKGLRELDVGSVREAASQKSFVPKQEKAEVLLGEVERMIVDALKDGPLQSGDLYRKLGSINERTLRNYIAKLVESGIIVAEEAEGKGKSRVLRLRGK